MSNAIKVETITDPETGLIGAVLTHADGTIQTFEPTFRSHEEAEAVIVTALRNAKREQDEEDAKEAAKDRSAE